jgi:hypothetical protein
VEFKVKSADPKSHLMICSAINMFGPHIIDSGISPDEGGKFYGFFRLDGSPDMIESLYHLPGIILEIPKKLSSGEDI